MRDGNGGGESTRPFVISEGDSSATTIYSNSNDVIDATLITVISFNIRGLKHNLPYMDYLLQLNTSHPKIICLCEHWLHTYDEHLLSTAFPNYSYIVESTHDLEGMFQPRIARGLGGIAILWDKHIDSYVSIISSDHFISQDPSIGGN